MIITDIVREEIWQQIAIHHHERGGALFGPRGYPVITHFEYDAAAETTPASYVPSLHLIGSVARIETERGLQFKGIVHSHPPGYVRPSPGDELAVESFFAKNPQFSTMALPIVQTQMSGVGGDRQDFIRWYRVELRKRTQSGFGMPWRARAEVGGLAVIDDEVRVIPIWEHVTSIVETLAGAGLHLRPERRLSYVRIQNTQLIGVVAKSTVGHEFIYLVSFDYPVVAPIILYQRQGATLNLCTSWNGLERVSESLSEICASLTEAWFTSNRSGQ
jgi:hypothetical protein